MSRPNYKKIYTDIITMKYPDKMEDCRSILSKSTLSTMDIINLQKLLFGSENISTGQLNQLHKSYDRPTILSILKYQKEHRLNNSQVAEHFDLSRNTVAKWKKMFDQDERSEL